MTKATWRRTELISPYSLWSIKKGSQGLNSRQEYERQKLKRGHGGVMPSVFMACSGLLSYIAQDHLPRDGTAHSGWVLPYKPLTDKILHRVAYWLICQFERHVVVWRRMAPTGSYTRTLVLQLVDHLGRIKKYSLGGKRVTGRGGLWCFKSHTISS